MGWGFEMCKTHFFDLHFRGLFWKVAKNTVMGQLFEGFCGFHHSEKHSLKLGKKNRTFVEE